MVVQDYDVPDPEFLLECCSESISCCIPYSQGGVARRGSTHSAVGSNMECRCGIVSYCGIHFSSKHSY